MRATTPLLLAGAAAGLLLAGSQLVAPGLPRNPDAVASVDGQPIPRREYRAYLQALAQDREAPLGEAQRRHVLQRLVEEELLLQRGLRLQLPRRDPALRKALIQTVIDNHLASAAPEPPGEDTLRRFYEQERSYFRPPPQLALRRLYFSDEQRARSAAAALADGTPFDGVASGSDPAPPLPTGTQPLSRWHTWLGGERARRLAQLEPGAITAPLPDAHGWSLYWITANEAPSPPAFEAVRDTVAAEWRRRRDEELLAQYLAELRAAADIRSGTP